MSKQAEEYYRSLNKMKSFTKLTRTGITDDLENVFEFAEAYHQSRVKELTLSNLKYKIKVLEEIQFMFTLHSDSSCNTNGYRGLLERIKSAKEQLLKQ